MTDSFKAEAGKNKAKSSVREFVDTIKDNPEEIIAWAKREIKEYQKLIKILERKQLLYVRIKDKRHKPNKNVCKICGYEIPTLFKRCKGWRKAGPE